MMMMMKAEICVCPPFIRSMVGFVGQERSIGEAAMVQVGSCPLHVHLQTQCVDGAHHSTHGTSETLWPRSSA